MALPNIANFCEWSESLCKMRDFYTKFVDQITPNGFYKKECISIFTFYKLYVFYTFESKDA